MPMLSVPNIARSSSPATSTISANDRPAAMPLRTELTTRKHVTEMVVVRSPLATVRPVPHRGAMIVQYHRHWLLVVTAGKFKIRTDRETATNDVGNSGRAGWGEWSG